MWFSTLDKAAATPGSSIKIDSWLPDGRFSSTWVDRSRINLLEPQWRGLFLYKAPGYCPGVVLVVPAKARAVQVLEQGQVEVNGVLSEKKWGPLKLSALCDKEGDLNLFEIWGPVGGQPVESAVHKLESYFVVKVGDGKNTGNPGSWNIRPVSWPTVALHLHEQNPQSK
jgi:hypothetical protein